MSRVLEEAHASFVESVPFRNIAVFTLLQLVYLLICFCVTWIPIAGIMFPLLFFLLISIRQHILPKFFQPLHLHELDASEYEEIPARTYCHIHDISFKVHNLTVYITVLIMVNFQSSLFIHKLISILQWIPGGVVVLESN